MYYVYKIYQSFCPLKISNLNKLNLDRSLICHKFKQNPMKPDQTLPKSIELGHLKPLVLHLYRFNEKGYSTIHKAARLMVPGCSMI